MVARARGSAPGRRAETVAAGPRDGAARGFDPVLAVLLLLGIAVWTAFRAYTHIRLEDALITDRYAENLATGAGFVFNAGERVLGTTTPLLTLILALAGRLFGVACIPVASNVLMIAAAAATAWLLHDVVERCFESRAIARVATAIWIVHPDTLWTTAGGLETPLVVLLMVASFALAVRGRWNLAALCTGLLVLTRPDGVVWAGLFALGALFELRIRAWKPLLVALLVVLPWAVFAWSYFGSPVPQSLIAKHESGLGAGSVSYVPWLLNSLALASADDPTPLRFPLWLTFVFLGATATLFAPGLRRLARWLVAFPLLFTLAFAIGRAPWFPWYLVPVEWCGVVLGVFGAFEMLAMLRAHAASRAWGRRAVPVLAAFAVLVVAWGIVARDVGAFAYHRKVQANEEQARGRIGEWLRQHTDPGAIVAMEAIGYQGTRSRRRVLDFAGIVSPVVLTMHRDSRSNAELFERLLDRFRPAAIVLRKYEFELNRHMQGGPLFEDTGQRDRFLAAYEPAFEVTAPYPDVWGPNASLVVWRRK